MQNVVRREGGSEYALYMGKEDSSQKPTGPLKKGLRQAAQSGAEAGGAGRRAPVRGADRPPASGPITSRCLLPASQELLAWWRGGEAEKGVVRTRRHLRRGCWSGLAMKNCEAETIAFARHRSCQGSFPLEELWGNVPP